MRFFDSVMMQAADVAKVPAGGALAVDRESFSREITEKINMLDIRIGKLMMKNCTDL